MGQALARAPAPHAAGVGAAAGLGLQGGEAEEAAADARGGITRRHWGGEEEPEAGPRPLDLRDEASVIDFVAEQFAVVRGGKCPRYVRVDGPGAAT